MSKLSKFKRMHEQKELLFLPNSWDTLSAVIFEQLGFKAIGTTSWGIANALGYQDGERIQFHELLEISKTIISSVEIPVTIDIEAGYSDNPEVVSDNVLKIADIGAAGINIEDSLKNKQCLKDVKEQCRLIEKIRVRLDQGGYKEFFINARTDTYLQKKSPLEETINRATHYVSSGANGIFVPGLCHDEEIEKLVSFVEAPLNIMSLPNLTDVDNLNNLGVKRYSIGNAFSDAVISYIEETAKSILMKRETKSLYFNKEIRTEFK